jgi:hypothetical protein
MRTNHSWFIAQRALPRVCNIAGGAKAARLQAIDCAVRARNIGQGEQEHLPFAHLRWRGRVCVQLLERAFGLTRANGSRHARSRKRTSGARRVGVAMRGALFTHEYAANDA